MLVEEVTKFSDLFPVSGRGVTVGGSGCDIAGSMEFWGGVNVNSLLLHICPCRPNNGKLHSEL